jgi:hypothetical protein
MAGFILASTKLLWGESQACAWFCLPRLFLTGLKYYSVLQFAFSVLLLSKWQVS